MKNMRKNIKRFTLILILLIILLFTTKVQAKEFIQELNTNYENWSKLQNKENYIQPVPFTINYETNSIQYINLIQMVHGLY